MLHQEDSILLWKAIVQNKLLKETEIVLFLNKVDIFKGTSTHTSWPYSRL